MKYQNKLKLKMLGYNILGFIILGIICLIAYFNDKIIETGITIVLFYIYRKLFEKQYHASSLYLCGFISIIVFTIIIHLEVSITISILFSVVLTFIITLISYYIRDYLDNKILIKVYKKKLESINIKALENLTEEEMIKLMPSLRYDVIHIVYEYLHRDKTSLNASGFAYRNGLSEATLYRYVKKVKNKYEELGKIS